MFSGGIERYQRNEIGYYNLFPQFPHLRPHALYHIVFVPALLVIFYLVSTYPNSFFFIWSQANLISNYSQKLQGTLHHFFLNISEQHIRFNTIWLLRPHIGCLNEFEFMLIADMRGYLEMQRKLEGQY